MPKIVASLFSGCGGLDLGFTGEAVRKPNNGAVGS